MEELNTVFLDLVFKCHEKQTKKALHKHTFTVAHLPGCFPAAAGSCASHSSPLLSRTFSRSSITSKPSQTPPLLLHLCCSTVLISAFNFLLSSVCLFSSDQCADTSTWCCFFFFQLPQINWLISQPCVCPLGSWRRFGFSCIYVWLSHDHLPDLKALDH